MSNLQQHEQIERYLEGTMDASEHTVFEQLLAQDEALAHEVQLQQAANTLIIQTEVARLQSTMQQIHANAAPRKAGKGFWILCGVLLVGAIVATALYLNRDKTDTTQTSIAQPQTLPDSAQPQQLFFGDTTTANGADQTAPQSFATYAASIGITDSLVRIDTVISAVETTYVASNPHTTTVEKADAPATEQTPEDSTETPETTPPPRLDPCAAIALITPNYRVEAPCFGEGDGQIEIYTNALGQSFAQFSIDGGKTFDNNNRFDAVAANSYTLIAQDDAGCLSAPREIDLAYKDCNYVVQPSRYSSWEMDVPNAEGYPFQLEIRNARTGMLVYEQTFFGPEHLSWNGTDLMGNTLPMANYVYLFISEEKGLVAKGQITVVE